MSNLHALGLPALEVATFAASLAEELASIRLPEKVPEILLVLFDAEYGRMPEKLADAITRGAVSVMAYQEDDTYFLLIPPYGRIVIDDEITLIPTPDPAISYCHEDDHEPS